MGLAINTFCPITLNLKGAVALNATAPFYWSGWFENVSAISIGPSQEPGAQTLLLLHIALDTAM